MNHYLLVGSSFLLLFNYVYNRQNVWEHSLAGLVFVNFALSVTFWMNPVKGSWIHWIDAIFAKISMLMFTIYIMFMKPIGSRRKFAYTIALSFVAVMAFFSNVYSRLEWTCHEHIMNHFVFHVFASTGTLFAFAPAPAI
jgi:hypothetical protein